MEANSPAKRDTDRILQCVRSPSKKRNLEFNGSNYVLNLREYPRSSKDPFVDDLTDSVEQMYDQSQNSPSKQRNLKQQMRYFSSQRNNDSQMAEERHFYRLFQDVLDRIADEWQLSEEQIKAAISAIKKSFHYKDGHRFSDVSLCDPDKACGYLFCLATLDAGLVRFRCLQAIQNCGILEHTLRRTELRVVSLGGGPGNDIVGFLSALHEARQLRDCHLEVSVVDAVDAWGDCVNLAKNLIQNGDFGSVSETFRQNRVDISFHETILPCNHDDSCYDALKKADIILISRLISIVDWTEKRDIMKNVYDLVQDSSLVLFIDVPFYGNMLEYFECLYQSGEDEYVLWRPNKRFNHWESGSSTAGISVLRRIID